MSTGESKPGATRKGGWQQTTWDGVGDVAVVWPDAHAVAVDYWSFYEVNNRFAHDGREYLCSAREEAASELLGSVADRDPGSGLELVVALTETAPDRHSLFFVGAGPLEDLFRAHGDVLAPRFVEAANNSSRFKIALSGVWPDRREPLGGEAMAMLGPYLGDDVTTRFE